MQLPLLLPKPQLSTSLFLTKQTGEDEAFQRLWRSYLDISNNAVDPLQLWIVQLVVIVGTATLLSRFLREIRQPKVIAEFLGGIILGPTVCGRIPGFTNTVFPPESLPYIKLTADIGLCLFLFLVGLEIDSSVLKKNLHVSASIALAGMVFPFIVGVGVAVPLYNQFMDMPMDDNTGQVQVHFTHFVFFAGVAFSVTAFPVLCRILVDAKLLDTTVGVAVLSAGVGNDVVGWILLALSVGFLKAGSAVAAIYMLLGCVIWILLLCFPIKRYLGRLARTTGSIESGPSVPFMTVVILVLFSSVLMSDIHGVHAIFGAFVGGVIIPREGNLAIALTEKLEDMVSIIFLPLYFALLGMSTDFWLLDDGTTWTYTAAIVLAAFASKFGSCALAARYAAGFSWRESGAIGSLMSCKGLVELIVLDVGLSAGILTPRVFTMFVLKALVLTFMTTPLVNYLYPPQSRRHTSVAKTVPFHFQDHGGLSSIDNVKTNNTVSKRRITIILDKLEQVPAAMAFSRLVTPHISPPQNSHCSSSTSTFINGAHTPPEPISIQALRLIELSDRPSTVMKSSINDALLSADLVLAVFRRFCELSSGLAVTPAIDIANHDDDVALSVAAHARTHRSDIVVLPWLLHTDTVSPDPDLESVSKPQTAPVTAVIRELQNELALDPLVAIHSRVFQNVMKASEVDVAIFITRVDWGPGAKHIFFPFFGGPDDRRALEFVAQLCENDNVSATVLRIFKAPDDSSHSKAPLVLHRSQIDDADDSAWEHFTSRPSHAGPRLVCKHLITDSPLHDSIHEAESCQRRGAQLLIVVGRGHDVDHAHELEGMEAHRGLSNELRKTLGSAGAAFMISGSGDGMIIFQRSIT